MSRLAYHPTNPTPYLSTIDVTDGVIFRCLINPKDNITRYDIKILKASDNSFVGEFYGTATEKYYRLTGSGNYTITDIASSDTTLPLLGTKTDSSWLQAELPVQIPLANSNDYTWQIKLTDNNSNTVTSFNYYFTTCAKPVISDFFIANPLETSISSFLPTCNTTAGISYYIYNVYFENEIIYTTDKIYSCDLSFTYGGFVNGKSYSVELFIEDNNGATVSETVFTTVSYTEHLAINMPILTVDNKKTCIDVDFRDNTVIPGKTDDNSMPERKIYKNPNETAPSSNNACVLIAGQNLYWDRANSIPLSFDEKTTIIHWHGHINFDGKIAELIDESDALNNISITYDGTGFYYRIGNNTDVKYNPFSNGIASAIRHSGESTEVDETYCYTLNESDTILNTDTIITNDITNKYWWHIIIKSDKIKFIKSKKYIDTVVS